MADIKKYLDQTGVQQLVTEIKAADAKTLQAAKDYSDSKDKNFDAAGAAATAKSEAIADADAKFAVVNENIAKKADTTALEAEVTRATNKENEIVASVEAVDEKADKNAEDIAAINNADTGILAKAKADATEKANAVQANVDALDEKVGDLPEGTTATDIVGYIQERTSGIATESALSELQTSVAQAQRDIDAIEADYLKNADKEELAGATATAQAAAEAAQAHSEGVASDLAEAVEALEGADQAQVTRIEALEETIVGLSGAMHFEGVKDEVPTDVTGYEQGDVIIVGNKEYVLNGGAFVEFGDASVNAEAITALTGRVATAEGEIDQLQTDVDNAEAAIALKADQTALDKEIADREAGDTALDNRLKVVEAQLGDGENSVSDLIATAKQEAITAATEASATDATNKANQALADAKTYTNEEVAKDRTRLDALEADSATHATKAEVEAVAGRVTTVEGKVSTLETEMDAVEKKASDNETAIGTINTELAKKAAQTDLDSAVARIAANETAIAKKAEDSDLDAAVERIAANEEAIATNVAAIAANASAIAAFSPIPASDITAMFA